MAENDDPILIGFGLATSISEKDLTGPDAPVGTPAYMSPEQALGQSVDGRADIYSLGVILYEMLCGKPFVWKRLRPVREEAPPPPPRQLFPEIPGALEAICLKAMAKHVNDRYTTAADLAVDLRSWLAGSSARKWTGAGNLGPLQKRGPGESGTLIPDNALPESLPQVAAREKGWRKSVSVKNRRKVVFAAAAAAAILAAILALLRSYF
jgi:serine/threonine protein kinase